MKYTFRRWLREQVKNEAELTYALMTSPLGLIPAKFPVVTTLLAPQAVVQMQNAAELKKVRGGRT